MAIRTMLFPGSNKGLLERVPWTVFTEPEVGQCGLTEDEAPRRYPVRDVRVARLPLERLDRAVTDHDRHGFVLASSPVVKLARRVAQRYPR